MDVSSVITFIYKIAVNILDKAELATACTGEALRIASRTRDLVTTLNSAAENFHDDARLQATLVELRMFLDSVPPLLNECVQPAGAWKKVRHMTHVKRLAEALVKKETELGRRISDLSLLILSTVGAQVNVAMKGISKLSLAVDERVPLSEDEVRKIIKTSLDRTLGHRSLSTTSTTGITGRAFGRVSKGDLVQDDEPFAEGTFGFVFGGTYCGKSVAIKKAKLDILPPKERLDFRREAELHFAMRHDNIVQVFAYNASSPVCLIMERMHQTLSDLLNLDIELALEDKMVILMGVANGLRFLHSLGIIHMDIKSPNILLDQERTPKLSDFGLADVASTVHAATAGTSGNKVAGSYQWMAPEVYSLGSRSREADVFSYGVVMHEVMTGQSPPRKSLGVVMSGGAVTRLLLGNVEDDYNIQEIIDRCTKMSPQARPRIEEVVETLQERQLPTMLFPADAGQIASSPSPTTNRLSAKVTETKGGGVGGARAPAGTTESAGDAAATAGAQATGGGGSSSARIGGVGTGGGAGGHAAEAAVANATGAGVAVAAGANEGAAAAAGGSKGIKAAASAAAPVPVVGLIAVAKYEYVAQGPEQLSFRVGDIVQLHTDKVNAKGWGLGQANGKVGWFPGDFVEIRPRKDPDRKHQSSTGGTGRRRPAASRKRSSSTPSSAQDSGAAGVSATAEARGTTGESLVGADGGRGPPPPYPGRN